MTFDKGDVVNVKSGGPALTVLGVDGEHVQVLFFSDELGEFKQATIPAFALEAFDAAEDQTDAEDASEEDEDNEEDDEHEHGHKAA